MRTCHVHIGTHKTGTTSLQLAMSENAPALLRHGYLYAATGRPAEVPTGHHNLAWEITADRRFRPAYGTLEDLIREVRHHSGDVILSSEGFESTVAQAHLEGLTRFVDQLQA